MPDSQEKAKRDMLVFLISFLGVMIGVLSLMLTWKWGKRKFAEYKQVKGDIGQLDYPDYAELLLRKYNRKFKVLADCGDLGGICDCGKKEIRLTYKPGTKKFEAFWEAAHEVGHAVWGQPALTNSNSTYISGYDYLYNIGSHLWVWKNPCIGLANDFHSLSGPVVG